MEGSVHGKTIDFVLNGGGNELVRRLHNEKCKFGALVEREAARVYFSVIRYHEKQLHRALFQIDSVARVFLLLLSPPLFGSDGQMTHTQRTHTQYREERNTQSILRRPTTTLQPDNEPGNRGRVVTRPIYTALCVHSPHSAPLRSLCTERERTWVWLELRQKREREKERKRDKSLWAAGFVPNNNQFPPWLFYDDDVTGGIEKKRECCNVVDGETKVG